MSELNGETLETLMEYGEDVDNGYGDLDDQGIDLSLLRLSSFNSNYNSNSNSNSALDRRNGESSVPPHPHSAVEDQSLSPPNLEKLSGSPGKRTSPENNGDDDHHSDEPRRKKQSLLRREDSDFLLSGYSKIQIPNGSNHHPTRNHTRNRTRSSPLLKRSLSDSYASPVKAPAGSGNISHEIRPLNSPSSIVKGINGGCSSSSLPPRPRPGLFRRCVSDPTNSSSPAKSLSRSTSSSSSEENLKSDEILKIIKEGALQMNQWFEKIVQFSEGFVEGETDASRVTEEEETEREDDEETREECKEGVSVERVGEGFVLTFNCPCGKTYRIFSSGHDCYYKLL